MKKLESIIIATIALLSTMAIFSDIAIAAAPDTPGSDDLSTHLTGSNLNLIWLFDDEYASSIATKFGLTLGYSIYYKTNLYDAVGTYIHLITPDVLIANGMYITVQPVTIPNSYIATNTTLDVYVTDPDADPMTVSFYWADNTLISQETGVADGSVVQSAVLDLAYETSYSYYILISDGGDEANVSKSFTTMQNTPPTISDEYPESGSSDVGKNPVLYVTVDDPWDDTLNAYWYSNSSGSWALFGSNTSINTSGGGVNISQPDSNFSYNTTYWWSVNVTDSNDWTNETYHLGTEENTPPTISDEYPVNGSADNRKRPLCHVDVTDPGDTVTVMFYENSTGVWVLRSTQVVTGTVVYWEYRQAQKWRTQYWWKVVADDSNDVTTDIYHFYTAHPKDLKGQRPKPHNSPNSNSPEEEAPGFELAFLLVAIILFTVKKRNSNL